MVIMSFMVLGIVSLTRLGIDLFPDVNFPFVNVSVVYPGAGPEEVETLVTRPIEDAVAGINGVKRVISTSTEGFARVGLELRLEVDAQAATAAAPGGVEQLMSFMPIILMFVVLYFLMIRPQMKRAKEQKAMIEALQKGDEVITTGGVVGKVAKVADGYVTIEVAEGSNGPVEMLVQKQAVQTLLPKGTIKAI